MTAVGNDHPSIATDDERAHLRALDRLLESARGQAAVIVTAENDGIELPEVVRHLLHQIVHSLARGEGVIIASQQEELTTQQAADLLNVSRPYLVGLVDRGEIPSRKVGARRRLKLADVLLYRDVDQARRLQAVADPSAEAQELGLY